MLDVAVTSTFGNSVGKGRPSTVANSLFTQDEHMNILQIFTRYLSRYSNAAGELYFNGIEVVLFTPYLAKKALQASLPPLRIIEI